ncbi:GDSL esterase/lipase At5g14450-like [Actinidia eriantha]|uniref:GDSL esterase/lipase At5g14450-like n=1 Tax=Actinidia eriantha TaxID=165200 RepID=UPI00258704F7|nr:GDSL esterase/lipase At5g14450-like [Actinidia eriantha]
MEILRFVVAWSLLVSASFKVGSEEVMNFAPGDIPAIYNFGDSNSDTGGIAAAFFPMAAPCGETFFHRPVGRASDGRLMIDFIAERLKLPYLSAYLDSVGTNFRHGANFATGGATIRQQNESWFENGISPFPLDIQVEHYIQFKARTAYLYSQANNETFQRSRLPVPEDFSKALYTFDIGQNDLAVGFGKMTDKQLRDALPDIVNQFAEAVQHLYQEGARAFWIHNTGPIGCLPISVVNIHSPNPGYLDELGCIKGQNDIAVEFNKQLNDRVIQLRAKLPQAALTYVDIYAAKYGLISNAKNQGFEDPFKICCGHHENGISIWCSNKAIINGTEVYGGSCANPSKAISWDGVHYTEAANLWIVNQILKTTTP